MDKNKNSSKWGATVKYYNDNDCVKPGCFSSGMAYTQEQNFWT